VSILCYHDIDASWHSPISVHPDSFARQIAWLASNRRVVSLSEAVRLMEGRVRLPAGVASVTFDDGFASTHEDAMPVLLREGVHASVFVVASTLERANAPMDWVKDAPQPRRALSLAQVLELRDAGFEIGSHSYTHRDLTTLDEREIVSDLRHSREVLEDLIGRPVTMFAYPGGRHDERVRRASATAGFQNSFAMADTDLTAGPPHAIPRVGIYRGDGMVILSIKTSPWFWRMKNGHLQPIARLARSRRPAP
jgi:peptidoglycan/xylan/chitin deacetylase (PgdA/CDA1 family)